MGHGQTNRSAHTYIPRRMHIHERFRSSPREPQTEIPSPCATGGRPPQTCLASWGLRPLFLRQQREAVISLSIRRQIRKLPYIYIYITIYILFASSDPHPCETKLVANMCRFVLETIRCREVLRGLSRNFLCRLHVSICIGGYRCREGLRGLSRDFLCRLYASICIGGYRCREGLRGLSRVSLCRLYVSIFIGGYSRRELLRGLSRDFLCRLYVSICIGSYSNREVLKGLSKDVFRRLYVTICVDFYWRL